MKTVKESQDFKLVPNENDKVKSKRTISAGPLLKGDFLADSLLKKHLSYLLLLSFLGTLYIANAYRAEKKMMEIKRLQERGKNLYTKYISIKSELMFTLTQSEIIKALEEDGLKQLTQPPYVINYNPKRYKFLY